MPKTNTVATKKAAAKPRMTPAERQAKKQLEREQIARQEQQKQAQFEKDREAIWLQLWARALQLLVLKGEDDLAGEDSGCDWWFRDLNVVARPGEEAVYVEGWSPFVTLKTLTPDAASSVKASLDTGFAMRETELKRRKDAEIERQRKAEVIKGAKAKLNSEERDLLGID